MKKTSAIFCTLLVTLQASAAPSANVTEQPAIIPLPVTVNIQENKPGYLLEGEISISKTPYLLDLQRIFSDAGINVKEAAKSDISFIKDSSLTKEAYKLKVTPDKITITSSTPQGAAYALTTLAQSAVKDVNGKACFPSMEIIDEPRFEWRAIMVDSGRHMLPVEDIKKILSLMEHYKFNTLHWHLTEDQGWRIEIKKYPKLTEIGSIRQQSPIMGDRSKGDGQPYGGYYTQEQIKDIVNYAKERNITVVPEIEVPGHASAAVAAYPELGNYDIENYSPKVVESWGVFPYIFNPSEKTFEFLDNVFKEVSELFPNSPYIHVGGDEAPKSQWKKSAMAQKIMKDNNLKDEHELQSYFIKRVEKIVNKYGKKLIGWDEINEGGLSPTATMMVWRNEKWADLAIKQGNNVIMVPTSHLYFDYGQGKEPKTPEFDVIRRKNLNYESVYEYDPVPKGLTGEQAKLVLGTQANHWSEYIPNIGKWEYHAFPRSLALAEIAWTPVDRKNIDDFKKRLEKHYPYLDKRKVNYQKPETGEPAIPEAITLQKSPGQK